MTRQLPTGTVTFLFTDVEGSTRLLHEHGRTYAELVAEHRRLLRQAFVAHGGVEVDTQGDAFFVAFARAADALAAAAAAQAALQRTPVRVRMGVHTGEPVVTGEGYVGVDVHKAARIAAAAHGGQVVLSQETHALVDGEVTELGEHRLKDFAEPVTLFQLGTERFPPLKTISNTNLPRPASSFVGRERELHEVTAQLRDGARLLTLTGPGGSGKTRLALEAAAELVPEFKAGVFWVGLAAARDPALVIETIAATLGAKDELAEHIGERDLLLLLDNVEQVVAAAPELASLVEACPNLRLMATSRELLRIRGEVAYPVLPLAQAEAIALFCARARSQPDELVEQLCRAVDNLPLALELAAARTRVLSPAQILERLSQRLDLLKGGRDADPRQQTLRAMIEWSHDLLSVGEQTLFRRLAVFVGGWSLDAAEEICAADLDTLQSLVDKNLLRHSGERFWMLETIREYAAERLDRSAASGALRERHAEYFLALALEAEPHLSGRNPGKWLNRLEREHDNLREALDRLEKADTELALRMAAALSEFWEARGYLAEGRRRLESLLRADEHPTAGRGRALVAAASLAAYSDDLAVVRSWSAEALELSRALGDAWGVANASWALGYAAVHERDWERARELLGEAVERFRELGDEQGTLGATRALAWSYTEAGDLDRARALHEANFRRARALGHRPMQADLLGSLATLAAKQGRVEEARAMLDENQRLYVALGHRLGAVTNLCRFAVALAHAKRAAAATQLISCYEVLREELGGGESWTASENERTLALARRQLDDRSFAEAWESGRTLTPDAAVALALDALRQVSPSEDQPLRGRG